MFAEGDEFALLQSPLSFKRASLLGKIRQELTLLEILLGRKALQEEKIPITPTLDLSTYGTESPAGSALSLVLDGGDGVLGPPVSGGGQAVARGLVGFPGFVGWSSLPVSVEHLCGFMREL